MSIRDTIRRERWAENAALHQQLLDAKDAEMRLSEPEENGWFILLQSLLLDDGDWATD